MSILHFAFEAHVIVSTWSHIHCFICERICCAGKSEFDFCGTSGFALATNSVLRLLPNGLCPLGVVCSSWVFLSRSSTKRHYVYPQGDDSSSTVANANVMNARVALLLLILVARGCTPLLEQPVSSLFARYPRMVHVCRKLRSLSVPLYQQIIHLGAFGQCTQKSVHVYSTNKALLRQLWKPISASDRCRFRRASAHQLLVTKTICKANGKTQVTGKKAALKRSQSSA